MKVEYSHKNKTLNKTCSNEWIDVYMISLEYNSIQNIIEYKTIIHYEHKSYVKYHCNQYIYQTFVYDENDPSITYTMLNSENETVKDKIREEIFIKFSEYLNDTIKQTIKEKEYKINTYDSIISVEEEIKKTSENYIRNLKLNKIIK